MKNKIRLGMVGGGKDAFIGAVHRMAARLDDKYDFVAGCLSSTPEKSKISAKEINLDLNRSYPDFKTMAEEESKRADGIEVVSIVTPNHMHAKPAIAFLEKGIHVICDKPMTATMDEAYNLYNAVKKNNLHFLITHNYSGYPLVREMKSLVQNGELGNIRSVRGSYLQGWLGSKEEDKGNNKQAEWRTDPKRSGAAGGVGDIGSHTLHLIEFITGIKLHSVAADLSTFVKGRKLDDDASILLRLGNGVKGSLSVSQIAVGEENNLSIAIYGEKASLKWKQENPNQAEFNKVGSHKQILTRASFTPSKGSFANVRIPPGHPEGYIEAFAQLYSDFADLIRNKNGSKNIRKILPNEDDGLHIMKFINSCVYSSNNNSKWINLDTI